MNWKKGFAVIIIISFLTSLFIGYQRHQVESAESYYEITMPYEEVVNMASFTDDKLTDALDKWRDVGVNSITLSEMTINSLINNGRFNLYARFEGNNLVLEGDKDAITMIAERLTKRLAEQRKISFRSENSIVIEGNINDFFKGNILSKYDLFSKRVRIAQRSASIIEFIGLGYLDEEIEAIQQAGLAVRFRPAYVYGIQNAKYSIDATLKYIDDYSKQPYICFSGNDVLGTDTELDYFAAELKRRNIAVVMIETPVQREFIEQAGLKQLVEKMKYQAVRAFSTFDFIRDRYDYEIPFHHRGEEVANTYFRAISERNIRVIFFKTYTRDDKMIDVPVSHYKDNLTVLEKRLKQHNILNIPENWDNSQQNFYMAEVHVNRLLVAVVAMGVAVAILLLINLFYALPYVINVLLSGFAIVIIGLVYGLNIKVAQFNLLFGLVSTMTFAMLSVYYIIWQARQLFDLATPLSRGKVFIKGVTVLFTAVALSLVGAAFEISFYADSKFLLEMAIFRGVKVSQVVPLMAAFVMALYYFGKEILHKKDLSRIEQVKYVLDLNVKIWQLLVGFVLLILVGLLLLRSGHESNIGTASLELTFRNFLEFFLYARPRTKALILGFPIVIFFMRVANSKKYAWSYPIFAFLVAIGQVDILNTFSHIRTTLQLSIARVLLAFVMSIVVYLIYALGVAVLVYIYKWIGRLASSEAH